MKHEVKGTGMPLNKKDLSALLSETKETLATDVVTEKNEKNFSAVDLWNIQKQHRPMVLRKWLN